MRKPAVAVVLALLFATIAMSCTQHTADRRIARDHVRISVPASVPVPVPRVVHYRHVYYVSPRGNDISPGTGSWPFRTISRALQALGPGDALYVRGGTYREQVKATHVNSGTPSHRVLVANAPGERPVISGQLWLAYPSYWTINGINVTSDGSNSNQHMINIYGGTGWVLQNSEIWGARSHAALLIDDGDKNNLGQFDVRNNCIHDTYRTNGANEDHSIYVDDTSMSPHTAGVIEHNLIFNSYNGRGIKLGPPGSTGGPQNMVVRYNTFFGAYQNISLSRQASHNRIYRNIFFGAAEANIGTYHLTGTDNVAYDNLAFSSARLADAGVTLGSGNRYPVDPKFDGISCHGFHPRVAAARAYGRFATGR
ncbi:MAG: hypothetical protein QOI55_2146 [Actinomycetota bacterium]|nr:hypothetical protein [Actinomycetota bacterium]